VKQNQQRQSPDRNVGEHDSADSGPSRLPRPERAHSGNRPTAVQESGLLRELKETPRHLD